jgi:hypothetical protein
MVVYWSYWSSIGRHTNQGSGSPAGREGVPVMVMLVALKEVAEMVVVLAEMVMVMLVALKEVAEMVVVLAEMVEWGGATAVVGESEAAARVAAQAVSRAATKVETAALVVRAVGAVPSAEAMVAVPAAAAREVTSPSRCRCRQDLRSSQSRRNLDRSGWKVRK